MLFWQKLACISPDEEEPNFLAPSAPRHGSPYHEIVIHLFQQTPEHKILSHEGKDQSNTGFNELERKDRRKHKGCSFPPAFFSHAISAQSLWESDTTVAKQFSCLTPAAYHHPTPLAEPHSTLQKKTSPALDFHQHQGPAAVWGLTSYQLSSCLQPCQRHHSTGDPPLAANQIHHGPLYITSPMVCSQATRPAEHKWW